MYRLEGVSKVYGAREVCHVDHLEIPRGSIMVLMGPSGAGKSTLLRLMGFLEPATSGTIIFGGHPYSDSKNPPLEIRRRVTMVFQTPVFFGGTVEQNVAYGLRFRGEPDARARVTEMLGTVGLSRLAKEKMKSVSTGEAQRVAIARALIFDPEVLLLDEPTANLDPQNVALVEELIAKAVHERGTTVVLVTQNVFQARRLAHQVGFMLDGALVEVGPPDTIFAAPVDGRTRAFVRGEMVY
ncbi:MAG: phosphate ABC transporter ATP-binding protein [Dehalococcoidia bacterium]